MLALSPHDLLRIVEGLAGATPTERGVALWHAVEPELREEALWRAPAGCLAHAMLDLRELRSGPSLELEDRCPTCDEAVEFSVSVPQLRIARPPLDNPAFDVEVGGRVRALRRVSCADLRAAERGEIQGRTALLDRCIEGGTDALADADCDRLVAILGERDPQADITFSMACPGCEHRWEGVFDACGVVWAELRSEANGLLYDVDAIARTYHWSEAEVLSLPPGRRRKYLELIDR